MARQTRGQRWADAVLVEECGFHPIDLSTKVAAEITLAAKTAEEIIQNNIHYIPRDVAQ
jgi:hypothetical protein